MMTTSSTEGPAAADQGSPTPHTEQRPSRKAKPQPEELLSINVLSRKLDVNYARISNLVHKGIITPDFTAQGTQLFRKGQVAKIRAIFDQIDLDRAVASFANY